MHMDNQLKKEKKTRKSSETDGIDQQTQGALQILIPWNETACPARKNISSRPFRYASG